MQHQVLFKHLFNKNAWDTDNLAMLQNEANAFPYFGLIHFFLLKETGIGHGSYTSIAGKLALHFNNPYNLHLKLHQNDTESIVEKQVEIAENLVRLETTPETLLTKPVQEKPAEKEELLFEPLFTTDYFASQGIKLSEEIKEQLVVIAMNWVTDERQDLAVRYLCYRLLTPLLRHYHELQSELSIQVDLYQKKFGRFP